MPGIDYLLEALTLFNVMLALGGNSVDTLSDAPRRLPVAVAVGSAMGIAISAIASSPLERRRLAFTTGMSASQPPIARGCSRKTSMMRSVALRVRCLSISPG